MMLERGQSDAEWLEWSGLPRALNQARGGAWVVFKKIVELDCRRNRRPGTVEITLAELAERCGLEVEATGKIIEALRRRKAIRAFVPEHPEEPALFEVRVPLATPVALAEIARRAHDPLLRDPSAYRYASADDVPPEQVARVQAVVDLYLNLIGTKLNTFVLDQIEVAARRFAPEAVRVAMERAVAHNTRTMGAVLKELIRIERGGPSKTRPNNLL